MDTLIEVAIRSIQIWHIHPMYTAHRAICVVYSNELEHDCFTVKKIHSHSFSVYVLLGMRVFCGGGMSISANRYAIDWFNRSQTQRLIRHRTRHSECQSILKNNNSLKNLQRLKIVEINIYIFCRILKIYFAKFNFSGQFDIRKFQPFDSIL